MDNFINLAKQGYAAYQESQGGHSPRQQGGDGDQYQDQRHRESQGVPQLDHDEVVNRANDHAENSGDSSLFSSALNHLSNRGHEHTQPVDEEHVTSSHREAYERGNAGNLDAGSMGAAAALQAFKKFTGGGGGGGGGGGSNQLISLAMGEATKLFQNSGGPSSGGKQDVVNSAAMTMMKMVVQSKLSSTIGGGNSGGLSSLMGMAGKFL